MDGPTTGGLIARGLQRRFRKGMHLINEGERGDTLFVVLSGRVRSYSFDARDREITYGVYGPGETLGEMSLDGGPRSASVVALEPTLCVVLTRQLLPLDRDGKVVGEGSVDKQIEQVLTNIKAGEAVPTERRRAVRAIGVIESVAGDNSLAALHLALPA